MTCSPGLAPDKQRRELGPFVLHLNEAFQERRLGVDRRAFGVGRKTYAQTARRPPCGLWLEIGEHCCRHVALALERIDPQVERSARRQRSTFFRPGIAESARKMSVEPFRIVTRHVRRRCADAANAIKIFAFIGSQFRGGILSAIGQFGDRLGIETTLTPEHAEKNRARCI